jgi:predicted permease
LTVAGLFVQHLRLVQHLDLGFDAERVLNARLDPRQVGYDAARTSAFYAELERRVRSWPEVESASLAFSVPLGYFGTAADILVDGRLLAPNEPAPSINFNRIGTDYFKTMGIPILEGRAIRDADRGPNARVAVVNKTMADLLWPGQEAIGRTFRLDKQDTPPWRVVGVARDSKYVLIFEQPRPYFYVPIEQRDQSMRVLQLRSSVPPASLAPRLDREIHALDPDMPVADLQTLQASLSGAMGFLMYRLGSYQAAALGGLGLLLAIVGVYGVVSHGAQQRTREIGIRIALGAHPTDVRRLILTQGLWIVAAGLLLGAGASAGAARVMEQFFTLATPSNLAVDVGIALGLAAIALGACYIPARRAMRVDPMVVLRHE